MPAGLLEIIASLNFWLVSEDFLEVLHLWRKLLNIYQLKFFVKYHTQRCPACGVPEGLIRDVYC